MTRVLKCFTIYDIKSQTNTNPVLYPNIAAAIRAFGDLCGNKDTVYNTHPEDFVLYDIGSFDVVDGVMMPEERRPISHAIEFVKKTTVSES